MCEWFQRAIARAVSAGKFYLFLGVNWLVQFLEVLFSIRISPSSETTPVIFILGAPRSGTTVSYQLLSNSASLQAFTNLHCKWFGAPFLVGKSCNGQNRTSPDFLQSIHGRTFGDASPSECGLWWARFFPNPNQISSIEGFPAKQKRKLVRSVSLMSRRVGKPIVFKNVYLCTRIGVLNSLFPDCRFVIVSRNLADTVRSIIKAREDTTGSQQNWFSIKPPGINTEILSTPEEQAREQVVRVYELIEHGLQSSAIPDSRVFRLSYERLCESPEEVLKAFIVFLAPLGVDVSDLIYNVPSRLNRNDTIA